MGKEFVRQRFQVERYGVGDLDVGWQYADQSNTLEGAWEKARKGLAKLQAKADRGNLDWDEHLAFRVIELHGEIRGDYTKHRELKEKGK